ncbi:RnfABCDGE type electron transport complex subunit D [Oscillospiraceae bacterium OttesenSCG-928-G22]|nr:RnfABCDGE type electron transport complex subunit D [Oscillospiraceae bacterium OttesenSCG-928-G22]
MATEKQLVVSPSPHVRSDESTSSIMLDVIIALMPALVISVYYFGFRSLTLTLVAVAASVLFEFLYQKLLKKSVKVGDLSAVVTGILLAYNLPANSPYWLPVVGSLFAIVIVKQLYGGIGKNFMNPALAARAFLFSWPAIMTTFPLPRTLEGASAIPLLGSTADVVTGATTLSYLKTIGETGIRPPEGFIDLLVGSYPGCLGATSAIALLIGGVYLVIRKVISPRIPLSIIGTVALIAVIFPQGGLSPVDSLMFHTMSGGIMLGSIFMATDYTTSPMTRRGQIIFGIGIGAITMFIRYFGGYNDGVCYSILIMNACVWFIDKLSRPRRYGTGRGMKTGVAK